MCERGKSTREDVVGMISFNIIACLCPRSFGSRLSGPGDAQLEQISRHPSRACAVSTCARSRKGEVVSLGHAARREGVPRNGRLCRP